MSMWVFGYGSLMWDGWEKAQGCVRRAKAMLRGYRRVFNKASVRNWGTEQFPCPTLNLIKSASSHCQGIAFEFSDGGKQRIMAYLTEREGKDFGLHELPAELDEGGQITVMVPVYEGDNIIHVDGAKEIVQMALQATGEDGKCVTYLKGIADELLRLGIEDPAVNEIWDALAPSR
jgi:cation transport protein ChaC